ncbi:MAG: hypothetical protein GX624_08335 [Actinobacteria bacterium]|nr:hypothetical protein [Actinomycetota bacterium]
MGDGASGTGAARPERRPSWLRAALLSLAVLATGSALGAAAYHVERSRSIQPPDVRRTTEGWLVTARHQREFSGLALTDEGLFWQNGASIEYLRLDDGRLRLLGPGPGMRTTWDPAADGRYVVWFEAERQASLAARAVVYDTRTGRRRPLADVGSVRSYPAVSGDVAVWCSARAIGEPSINGLRIGGGGTFEVAPGDGAPVVSGGLVVWATSRAGPFVAAQLASGTSWPVTAGLPGGRLTGLELAGRTLVWGQSSSRAGSGVVSAVSVDGGETTVIAENVTGLSGPAYDGRTVVWGERTAGGSRVMAAGGGWSGSPPPTAW